MFKFFKKNKPEEIKIELKKTPTHVAIIMDGNGRWAKKKKYAAYKGAL